MIAQASSGESGTRLAVTYREAGDALGVCERVVWQLVKDGRLKAVRIGRSVRIPVAELERFVSASAESV
ncbi:MAG: helix-turn-helix domain-containing protein [Planctomycetota bacterium]|nr:helix-turn-helix domain-containing protein [Planctomycetota bacterium]